MRFFPCSSYLVSRLSGMDFCDTERKWTVILTARGKERKKEVIGWTPRRTRRICDNQKKSVLHAFRWVGDKIFTRCFRSCEMRTWNKSFSNQTQIKALCHKTTLAMLLWKVSCSSNALWEPEALITCKPRIREGMLDRRDFKNPSITLSSFLVNY